jgi:hypothetical protein
MHPWFHEWISPFIMDLLTWGYYRLLSAGTCKAVFMYALEYPDRLQLHVSSSLDKNLCAPCTDVFLFDGIPEIPLILSTVYVGSLSFVSIWTPRTRTSLFGLQVTSSNFMLSFRSGRALFANCINSTCREQIWHHAFLPIQCTPSIFGGWSTVLDQDVYDILKGTQLALSSGLSRFRLVRYQRRDRGLVISIRHFPVESRMSH